MRRRKYDGIGEEDVALTSSYPAASARRDAYRRKWLALVGPS